MPPEAESAHGSLAQVRVLMVKAANTKTSEISVKYVRPFAIPLVLSAVLSLLLYAGIFNGLETLSLDFRLSRLGGGKPAPVAFASISQNSLKALGQWPFPRSYYARAMGKILDDGARAVLVDVDFSSPGPDPEQDRQLAEFISERGKIVLAIQMEEKVNPEGAVIRSFSLPLPALAKGAAALGSITFETDTDGFIRRMPSPIDFNQTTFEPLGIVGAVLAGSRNIPDIPSGAFITFSAKNLRGYDNVSFEKIFQGNFSKGIFRDRIVLLGSTAPDLHDFWPTPIGVIPGMYIQASVMETALNGSWSVRQGYIPAVLSLFLLSIILGRFLEGAGWKAGTVYLVGYLFLVILLSAVLARNHIMIQTVPLLVLGIVQYPLQIIADLRRTEGKLELQRRRTDAILKFSELQEAEDEGKGVYQIPLVLLRQLLGLTRICFFFRDADPGTQWRVESVFGEGAVTGAGRETILAEVVEKRQVILDKEDPDSLWVYLPMMTLRRTVGVLSVKGPRHLLRDEENIRLLLSHATQTSYFLEASELDSQIKILYSSTIRAISKALDKKDYYTSAHSELSLEYVERFGRACGLSKLEIEALHIGTLLHDIGKIGVPDRILAKEGPLTSEEFQLLKSHPDMGFEIIRDLPLPEDVRMIVKHHHEHFDGTGYPDGLTGKEIPRIVRIFSVLDTYEALVGERPYKAPYTPEEAKKELRRTAGTQFDPGFIEIFESIV